MLSPSIRVVGGDGQRAAYSSSLLLFYLEEWALLSLELSSERGCRIQYMCWRFAQACTVVGGTVCAEGVAILLKVAQKSLVEMAWYFLAADLAALSLASTSWLTWMVLCQSSLVGSGAGSMRVSDGDGDISRYSIDTLLSLSSLSGWIVIGLTRLVVLKLNLISGIGEGLRYLRDSLEELEVANEVQRGEVCIVEMFGFGLRMEW